MAGRVNARAANLETAHHDGARFGVEHLPFVGHREAVAVQHLFHLAPCGMGLILRAEEKQHIVHVAVVGENADVAFHLFIDGHQHSIGNHGGISRANIQMVAHHAVKKPYYASVAARAADAAHGIYADGMGDGMEEVENIAFERVDGARPCTRMLHEPHFVRMLKLAKLPANITRQEKSATPRNRAVGVAGHLGIHKRFHHAGYGANQYGIFDIRRDDVAKLVILYAVEHHRRMQGEVIRKQAFADFRDHIHYAIFVKHRLHTPLAASAAARVFIVHRAKNVIVRHDDRHYMFD